MESRRRGTHWNVYTHIYTHMTKGILKECLRELSQKMGHVCGAQDTLGDRPYSVGPLKKIPRPI